MPRSFLIKKQSEPIEENHGKCVPQGEGCVTGTQIEYDSVRKVQHFGVKAELETEKTGSFCSHNTTNLATAESQSGKMKEISVATGEMGAHVTWLCGAQAVSFFNRFTPDQPTEHEINANSASPIRNVVKAESALDNESSDGEPIKDFSGSMWEPNPEILAAGNRHITSYHGFYDNQMRGGAPSSFLSPRQANPSHFSFELVPFYSCHDNYFPHQPTCFSPHGNSSISRSENSYIPFWQNKAKATSNDPFLYIANQKCSPKLFSTRQAVPLCTPQGGRRSAFRPYIHTNMRYTDQHSQWNEPILKASLECDDPNAGHDKNSSDYSLHEVPNCKNVSSTWYSTQQEAYTEPSFRKAIAFPEEIKSGYFETDVVDTISGSNKSGACTHRSDFMTQSDTEETNAETAPEKPEKPKKKYPCDICGRSFSRSSTLTTHRRIHSGEKPFVCQLCGRAFRQPGNLSRHRLTHTTAKPYVCVHCNKAFNRASNLHTHMRTHTDYKPFACEFCGKRFHQKVDMKIHRYTHTGEKPHKCHKCGRGFKQLTHLTYHMRTHSEERMYHCPYCGKGFNQKGNMQAHIYRHTGERPFKCETCGKGFTLASTLNTHKRTHAAHKPFQCEFCDKAFYQRNGLKTHYIASHPFSAGMSLL